MDSEACREGPCGEGRKRKREDGEEAEPVVGALARRWEEWE